MSKLLSLLWHHWSEASLRQVRIVRYNAAPKFDIPTVRSMTRLSASIDLHGATSPTISELTRTKGVRW